MYKVVLAMSSYVVLNALLLVRYWGALLGWINLALLVLGLVGAVAIIWFAPRKTDGDLFRISRPVDQAPAAASYLVSFVLPIAFIDGAETGGIAMFAIIYVLLVGVSVRAELYQINPTFVILFHHLTVVDVGERTQFVVISRKRIREGDSVQLVELGEGLMKVQS
jgi:hypothetical protein